MNNKNEHETIYYKNHSQKLVSISLTNREKDIVRLLAINNTSNEIAEKLCISYHTVGVQRKNILENLILALLKSSCSIV
ncbi:MULTISPECIES: response regulator transcription factor [unclassified Polaribacter]|uniref:response regulator transcription factor n=1 Tax=unclassified Polaribacter TaxID=196858 RepID=UPI001676FAFF|nr:MULTISPECIES: LuxR C-terminal-related transcriptional regulator [unclassified Polaribacter]